MKVIFTITLLLLTSKAIEAQFDFGMLHSYLECSQCKRTTNHDYKVSPKSQLTPEQLEYARVKCGLKSRGTWLFSDEVGDCTVTYSGKHNWIKREVLESSSASRQGFLDYFEEKKLSSERSAKAECDRLRSEAELYRKGMVNNLLMQIILYTEKQFTAFDFLRPTDVKNLSRVEALRLINPTHCALNGITDIVFDSNGRIRAENNYAQVVDFYEYLHTQGATIDISLSSKELDGFKVKSCGYSSVPTSFVINLDELRAIYDGDKNYGAKYYISMELELRVGYATALYYIGRKKESHLVFESIFRDFKISLLDIASREADDLRSVGCRGGMELSSIHKGLFRDMSFNCTSEVSFMANEAALVYFKLCSELGLVPNPSVVGSGGYLDYLYIASLYSDNIQVLSRYISLDLICRDEKAAPMLKYLLIGSFYKGRVTTGDSKFADNIDEYKLFKERLGKRYVDSGKYIGVYERPFLCCAALASVCSVDDAIDYLEAMVYDAYKRKDKSLVGDLPDVISKHPTLSKVITSERYFDILIYLNQFETLDTNKSFQKRIVRKFEKLFD